MKKFFAVITALLLLALILEYIFGLSNTHLGPRLRRILGVPDQWINPHFKTVFSKRCDKSFTIDSRLILKDQWQPMDNKNDTHNVFSAYFHQSGSSPIIRIVGNFNRYYKAIPLYCQLWYIDHDGAPTGSMINTNTSVHKLQEGGDSR